MKKAVAIFLVLSALTFLSPVRYARAETTVFYSELSNQLTSDLGYSMDDWMKTESNRGLLSFALVYDLHYLLPEDQSFNYLHSVLGCIRGTNLILILDGTDRLYYVYYVPGTGLAEYSESIGKTWDSIDAITQGLENAGAPCYINGPDYWSIALERISEFIDEE